MLAPRLMGRSTRILAASLAALALVPGCASTSDKPGPVVTSTGAAFPVTVGSLTLDKRPERIVALGPTATEMLFAVSAGPQVVAVDDLSNFPSNAPKTSLSAYKPNAEAIATYKPDLVVLTNDSDKISDQLKALRIPTYVAAAASTLDDTYKEIDDLGKLTGHPEQASGVTTSVRGEVSKLVAALPKRTKPLTYYYELDQNLYSVTSKTFIGSLFTMAGLVNIADGQSTDYPQLSAETIVKANPDLIFLADTKCCGQSASTVAQRPGWSGITAVRANQIAPLDDDIASRWGPRVVDLLRAITDAVAKVPSS
jgi:iron complex transport system substrate-binding protein